VCESLLCDAPPHAALLVPTVGLMGVTHDSGSSVAASLRGPRSPRVPERNLALNYLDWAAQNTVFESIAAVQWANATLSDGAEPIYVDAPLMNAVQDSSLDKVTFLLDHGADADARSEGFHRVASGGRDGAPRLVRVLLERGA